MDARVQVSARAITCGRICSASDEPSGTTVWRMSPSVADERTGGFHEHRDAGVIR
jgi:hypothetical protein